MRPTLLLRRTNFTASYKRPLKQFLDLDLPTSSDKQQQPEDAVRQTQRKDTSQNSLKAEPAVKPFSGQASEISKSFGFLFDCDGVLYQGGKQIQSAGPALRLCRSHNARYLFLTNGGGNTTEAEKAASLHKKVGIPESEDLIDGRVIQSHTPFKIFNEEKKRNDVIYTTSLDPDKARDILKHYGFRNVVTAADLLKHDESIFPFSPKSIGKVTAQEHLPNSAKLWKGPGIPSRDLPGHLKIDHIFILNDPRDWALETQIIYDLLISHQGYYGSQSKLNGDPKLHNRGWQRDGQPMVWISNVDLFWKTEHPQNRFGTGAFLHALRGVWEEATRVQLLYKEMGKPSQITYEYAHKELLQSAGPKEGHQPLRRVYMIGDNPESDVRGALEYKPADGTEYVPILVKTGVYRQTNAKKKPNWEPAVIVHDVLDAVVWAMRQEGIEIDRQTAMAELSLKDNAELEGSSPSKPADGAFFD